jgi:hypothetical protein
MKNKEFKESQQFRQPLLWGFLILLLLFSLFIIYKQIVLGNPPGNNPASNLGLIIVLFFIVSILIFFLLMRLDTEYNSQGIYYRFYPIQLTHREIKWDVIKSAYIRKYRPTKEYGGWGIRFGMKNGIAYNVSGNEGLQIELYNGEKLLFGTQKPEKLKEIIKTLGKYKF